MFIDMLPGARRENLLSALRQVMSDADGVRNRTTSPQVGPSQLVADYVNWANRAASMLNYQISQRDMVASTGVV